MFNQFALWTWPPAVRTENPQRLVDRSRAAGIDILMPYVSRGAIWEKVNGKIEVAFPQYEDNLHKIIAEAHRQGLKVHACFDDMRVGPHMPEAVRALNQFRQGGTPANELCPANPAVADYILGVLRRLLTEFDYDGINLEDSYIFNPNTIYDPAHQIGTQFRSIPVCYCDWCQAHAPIEKPEWTAWKQEALNKLVTQLAALTRQLKPGAPFSAAARMPYRRDYYAPYQAEVPYYDGWNFCQSRDGMMADWAQWQKRGALDFSCPMTYFNDTRLVELQTQECRQLVADPNNNLWMGLALGENTAEYCFGATKGQPAFINDARKLTGQLELQQRFGQKNCVFFSYESLHDEYIPVLARLRKT
jgi:uncharacterized lipoprotein YddW (UPF0748 family)